MTRFLQTVLAVMMLVVFAPASTAHEVNPAYLELVETAPASFEVTWKQPLKDGRRLKLRPAFPDQCTSGDPRQRFAGGAVIETWQLNCALADGDIRIDGLERTLTDVFVKIEFQDRAAISGLLRPSANQLKLDASQTSAPLLAYFRIGVDHIIFGYDHLLFVLGLCLLVKLRQLFVTITAFTVAHSITLGLSTMAGLSLPGAPVETVIALSLVLLAREGITVLRGGTSLTSQYPWLVAFGFGLIHGFGFAGALSNIGLPQSQEISALLLFNLGVEAGQIVFVIAVFLTGWLLIQLSRHLEPIARQAAAYLVGISGTYWVIERLIGM